MVERYEIAPIVSVSLNNDATTEEYLNAAKVLQEELTKQKGVQMVIPEAQCYAAQIKAVIGSMRYAMHLTQSQYIEPYLRQFDATLIDGQLPKQPGEVIVDEQYQKNNNLSIGDQMIDGHFIVGVVSCKSYLVLGINQDFNETSFTVLLDSSFTIDQVCKGLSLPFNIKIEGPEQGLEEYNSNVASTLEFSTNIITIIATILLFTCLLVIIQMHFRDRNEEWCLYHSLGYSLYSIYQLAMKELIVTLLLGLSISTVITSGFMIIVDRMVIKPQGLLAAYLLPDSLTAIITILILFIGCCQLPLMQSMNRIDKVDVLEAEE